jgi:hypothetical protein
MLDYEPRRASHNSSRSAFVIVLWAALACAIALNRVPAQAQDEIDATPSTTLEDHSERERLGPAKTDKKARDLFEKGRAAWDEGRFREAWEHWHHSYRLSRRPELLYNVGQAADRLRMDREALEAFRLYLEKNPDASNRKEVENRIRILEREVDNAPAQRTDYLAEGLGDDAAASGTAPAPDEGAAATEDYKGEESDLGEDPSKGARSGLYLRLTGGIGFWADSISDTAGNAGSLSSLTLSIDAMVGYGVLPELAVGGGVMFEFALAPSFEANGAAGTGDVQASLGMLFGFADYYLDPKDGWHIFGGLGFGRLAFSGGGLGNEDAGGGALFAGLAYELPIDDEISLDVAGRVLIGRFSQDIADHTLFAPAITASALWF